MKQIVSFIFSLLPRFLRRHKVALFLLKTGLLGVNQKTCFNGKAIAFAHIRDAEARNVFLTHRFEPEFFDVAVPFCWNAKVVFDIGANSGFCSFGIASKLPTPVSFHLFEVSNVLVDLLHQSIQIQPPLHSFKVVQGCVSDHEGFSSISFSEDYLCAQVTSGSGSIPNVILDTYVDQQKIESVDFIKMDIEGSEIAALKGWSHFLTAKLVKAMYVEVCAGTLKNFGSTTKDLIQLIEGYGYECFYCKEPELSLQPHRQSIHVNGTDLIIAPCSSENIPADFQSDVLAFPAGSPWIVNARNIA